MSNILKVTPPPQSYENNVKNNPIAPQDQTIQNIVDPSRVTRPDGKGGSVDEKFQLINYNSNFEGFMALIKDLPQMESMIAEFFFTKMENLATSNLGENFAEELSRFMEMMKMSEPELLSFLKDQSASSVKFQGPFFDVLRQVMSGPESPEMKGKILEFLKKYNDVTASKHLMSNIHSNLQNIASRMYQQPKEALEQMIKTLLPQNELGEVPENSQILKEKIIPFIADYISRSHDYGKIRDFVSMLTLNTARYENANKDSFFQLFKELMNYTPIKSRLGGLGDKGTALLQHILLESGENKSQSQLMTQLVEIIKKGIEGRAGFENKAPFDALLKSVLLNESVFMPVLHFMIPADINGTKFFSEVWVDPDSDSDKSQGGGGEKETRLLIKFDIQDVGFFDLIILAKGSNVDIQLYYPEKLLTMEKDIRQGLSDIMERNSLNCNSLHLEKAGVRPKSITEVFPKLYERKNSINVTI